MKAIFGYIFVQLIATSAIAGDTPLLEQAKQLQKKERALVLRFKRLVESRSAKDGAKVDAIKALESVSTSSSLRILVQHIDIDPEDYEISVGDASFACQQALRRCDFLGMLAVLGGLPKTKKASKDTLIYSMWGMRSQPLYIRQGVTRVLYAGVKNDPKQRHFAENLKRLLELQK